ncbi:fatty acid CoA ligase family protein [Planctomicrobium piriforme]|uniref:Acyl-CoA synthetase (AMP-forming)/AMP-acid ligase II n=1 Tax=Planctomicrobium piriforme TaxID=1576369 RepID=A0A1I3JU50_9PLAN|nr:fatty acid CoA ligase family protein [Planctomicrobium piriforme]SFI63733.1 Acyl-CoA synthetase (AMP-forming)/AMP-acid ligase II [Planctomicrobium piriforme]
MAEPPVSDRNISRRLTEMARLDPDRPAVIAPSGRAISFAQLDERSTQLAAGLAVAGVRPGMKLVLFVPFSIEFVELTFALFKTGAIVVLIDPGMGRANIFNCLNEVQPDGFVAVPIVHVVRWFAGGASRRAALNFCVGPWLPGITATYRQLIRTDAHSFAVRQSAATDSAAIIFTSGSTGPPKGVLYEHGMFDAQVDLIRDRYGIVPGDVDLPGFPLFGLFNSAMGVTTVIPDMDPTRPAEVDPEKILKAIQQHNVTQAFGSPAFWNRVGRYCAEKNLTLPTLKRALSAGGPVPGHVLQRMSNILTRPDADLFTPYGATESLPVSSIGAREILESTAPLTKQGAGTCVGTTFPGMRVKILPMTDGPISSINAITELPPGEIGEIVVCGPSVTREYYQRPDSTRLAKIPDGDGFWHRIGDVGYLDSTGRLWFCGRKAHVVVTPNETMFSVCCEAIFNEHPRIYRSALVGIGPRGQQRPAIVAEPEPGQFPKTPADEQQLRDELLALGRQHAHTQNIRDILFHPSLPVDTRHNVKINREALAMWAAPKFKPA